jgi:tetratricopeptide (TPR) repeat protein
VIELILQAERALSVGQLEQAERLYRQAAEADPRNSIAVVGLARVALDRGDDRGAFTLARHALDIDPENAAAQRLADRLEEVMRYRGEEPPMVDALPQSVEAPEARAPAPAAPAEPPTPPGPIGSPAPPTAALPPTASAPPAKGPPPLAPKPAAAPRPRRRSLLDRIRRRH